MAEAAVPSEPQRRKSKDESRCSVEGCKRPYRAKTYCNVHYKLWRRGELPTHRSRYKCCVKEGCFKRRAVGSLCQEHAKGEPAAA